MLAQTVYHALVKGCVNTRGKIFSLGHNTSAQNYYFWIYNIADIGNTLANLKYAAEGEKEEWTDAYPSFAAIAKEEGFTEVETAFNNVGEV